jgi:hypothetical protein
LHSVQARVILSRTPVAILPVSLRSAHAETEPDPRG